MFTYILKSLKDSRYYYGSTENIELRLKAHNSGSVPSTRYRRPLIIHYFEKWNNPVDARARERFFKSVDGYRFLKDNGII